MIKKIVLTLFLFLGFNIIYSNEIYILKKGDTLYRLSKKYNIGINEIIEINKLGDITALPVGSKILIPVVAKTQGTYTVKRGDTLFSISKKFNLSLSKIMKYNDLEVGDIIFLGQVLQLAGVPDIVVTKVVLEKKLIEKKVIDSVPFWPVSGSISKYSGRIQGVKIEGISGDYIKAVSNGKVIWYDSFKGIGKVVLIEGDNGYDYLYGAKENLDVRMGVYINAGERLGRLKDSNTSIIFSVFKNGKPLNDISKAPR